MDYRDFCTPMEKAVITKFCNLVKSDLLHSIPSNYVESILHQNFTGSYSRLHWFLTDIIEDKRALDIEAIKSLRNISEYMGIDIDYCQKNGEVINAAKIIFRDLQIRKEKRSSTVKLPVLGSVG
jgi:hypothetical protein